MNTRDKLKLAKEIDARNAQHLEDWKKGGKKMGETKIVIRNRMEIETNDPAMMEKLDSLIDESRDSYRCVERGDGFAKYEAPADLLEFI